MNRNKNLYAAASCSAGRAAYEHDIRKNIEKIKNVDRELTPDNVVLINRVGNQSVRKYIDKLMQPSIDEYNAKQKRKDRKITVGYSEWHKSQPNKGDLVYEWCLQYGDGSEVGGRYYAAAAAAALDPNNREKQQRKAELKQEFIDTYKEWARKIEEEYGIHIAWATIHFDEGFKDMNGRPIPAQELQNYQPGEVVCGTPHMHLGLIPKSDYEFKRGPKTQISLAQVLEKIPGCERIVKLTDAKMGNKNGFQQAKFFQMFHNYQSRYIQEVLEYKLKTDIEKHPKMKVNFFKEYMYAKDAAEKAREEAQQAVSVMLVAQETTAAERSKADQAVQKQLAAEAAAEKARKEELQSNHQMVNARKETRIQEQKSNALSMDIAAKKQEKQELVQENETLQQHISDLKQQKKVLKALEPSVQKLDKYSDLAFQEPHPTFTVQEEKKLGKPKVRKYIYDEENQELLKQLSTGKAIYYNGKNMVRDINNANTAIQEAIEMTDIPVLRQKNAELQQQIEELQQERDACFDVMHNAGMDTIEIHQKVQEQKERNIWDRIFPLDENGKRNFIGLQLIHKYFQGILTKREAEKGIIQVYGRVDWEMQKMINQLKHFMEEQKQQQEVERDHGIFVTHTEPEHKQSHGRGR